jgi:eukaryotic-like serine/threonine-protein kinase
MKFTFAPETRPLDGYTIKRAIHRGGFGEVYYALSDAGKEVALKLLNNNLDVELRGVTQCLNLKHPNLVTIFDIRQDDDKDYWVIMEYVNGRGLYEVLRDHPRGMSVADILSWLSGISAGLTFLHDRGIVHRDLKPANVFRDHTAVKIGDVGLSKYISESRRSAQTQSVGTVYYMAPEVARGRYGREVDVYALGVMLYEMLTGNVPFEGQTTAEILMKHLTAEPDLSVLPERLRPVIQGALEKDPDRRTRCVEDVEMQFRHAVAGTNVQAPIPLLTASTTSPGVTQVAAPPIESRPQDAGHSVKPGPTATLHEQATAPHTAAATASTDTTFGQPLVEPASPEVSTGEATGLSVLVAYWNALPAPLQWVFGGAVALLVIESGMLRPVAVGGMIGGVAYLGYQLLTVFVAETQGKPLQEQAVASGRPKTGPSAVNVARPVASNDSRGAFRRRKTGRAADPVSPFQYSPYTIRRISWRQRATDTSTSLSISLAAAAMVTVAVFLTTDLLSNSAQAIYFGTVTLLAACGIIVPSKIWEGRRGDGFTRRLCLAGIGLGIGYIAAVLPEYLLINNQSLFHGGGRGPQIQVGRISLSDGSGYPTFACFMIFFASLFAVRRWWWQADSFRKSRFRVSSALFTLLLGVILASVLQQYGFPDSLGATWALAVSAVVQLSSGWTPAEDRKLRPVSQNPVSSEVSSAAAATGHEAAAI